MIRFLRMMERICPQPDPRTEKADQMRPSADVRRLPSGAQKTAVHPRGNRQKQNRREQQSALHDAGCGIPDAGQQQRGEQTCQERFCPAPSCSYETARQQRNCRRRRLRSGRKIGGSHHRRKKKKKARRYRQTCKQTHSHDCPHTITAFPFYIYGSRCCFRIIRNKQELMRV